MRIGMVVVVVVAVSFVVLWLAGKEPRVVTTEIVISAPPVRVWSVLQNIDEWKDWSPIIKDSSGTAALGSVLKITMISEEGKSGKPGPRYEPVITIFDAPRNLTWSASMLSELVMTNGKVLELEEIAAGTRLVHKETFSGMMIPLMWGSVQKNVPNMLNSMNQALKELVEGNK